MKTINLVRSKKPALEYDVIAMPDIEADQLPVVLQHAEAALYKYRAMLNAIDTADSLTDNLAIGTWLYDFMTEYCSVKGYEDSALDITHALKMHLQKQVARFVHFCDDLEAEIEDNEALAKEEKEYGTYEDQVRFTYNNSRL